LLEVCTGGRRIDSGFFGKFTRGGLVGRFGAVDTAVVSASLNGATSFAARKRIVGPPVGPTT
jgi:hypothetical protein